MHEYSICQALVAGVLSELDQLDPPPVRLLKARVVVGALRQIVPEFLESAYTTLTNGTEAAGSCLEIRSVPVEIKCGDCDWQGPLPGRIFQCPKCESIQIETLSGMELYLEGLQVEEA